MCSPFLSKALPAIKKSKDTNDSISKELEVLLSKPSAGNAYYTTWVKNNSGSTIQNDNLFQMNSGTTGITNLGVSYTASAPSASVSYNAASIK